MYNLFEVGGNAIIDDPMEARIALLYQLLDKGIMPWQWDYDNYTGDNSDMMGFFYPEDLHAITQISQLENEGAKRRQSSK